jgi:hypothetical protein
MVEFLFNQCRETFGNLSSSELERSLEPAKRTMSDTLLLVREHCNLLQAKLCSFAAEHENQAIYDMLISRIHRYTLVA